MFSSQESLPQEYHRNALQIVYKIVCLLYSCIWLISKMTLKVMIYTLSDKFKYGAYFGPILGLSCDGNFRLVWATCIIADFANMNKLKAYMPYKCFMEVINEPFAHAWQLACHSSGTIWPWVTLGNVSNRSRVTWLWPVAAWNWHSANHHDGNNMPWIPSYLVRFAWHRDTLQLLLLIIFQPDNKHFWVPQKFNCQLENSHEATCACFLVTFTSEMAPVIIISHCMEISMMPNTRFLHLLQNIKYAP